MCVSTGSHDDRALQARINSTVAQTQKTPVSGAVTPGFHVSVRHACPRRPIQRKGQQGGNPSFVRLENNNYRTSAFTYMNKTAILSYSYNRLRSNRSSRSAR